MARLFASGFETGNLGEWSAGGGTVGATYARTGGYGLLSDINVSVRAQIDLASSVAPRYPRFCMRIPSGQTPTAQRDVCTVIPYNGTNATKGLVLKLNADRTLQATLDGVNVGGVSGALAVDTWYRIECAAQYGVSGLFIVRIEGTDLVNTTQDYSGGTNGTNSVSFNGGATNSQNIHIDDVTIDDAAFPGPGGIVALVPNGAGGSAQWTRGGTDSGANWSQCDEQPPNDATDYVLTSTNLNLDGYALSDFGETFSSIYSAWAVVRHKGTGTTARTFDFGFLDGASEAVQSESAAHTTWQLAIQTQQTTRPGGQGAWTKAALDALQSRIRHTTSQAREIDVTAIYIMVEFVPSPKRIARLLAAGGVLIAQPGPFRLEVGVM